ncbi:MAG: TIGR04283 family arsenosugar biosynthesis glycosyltransferase [Nitrospinota bacterium]|nr:TIGR04283 family arsenosugar biosynthesis glycosyltransferase [Nitrospinota bacterium]
MKTSIIIPTLNEARYLSETLAQIQQLSSHEIIISDGGSNDNTLKIASKFTQNLIKGSAGRALQMNAGAQVATGDLLLFLHADSYIERASYQKMLAAMKKPEVLGGAFSLLIDSDRWALQIINQFANLRSRYLGRAYGDQAFFVKKHVFQEMKGFTEFPICEDLDFYKRLKFLGPVVLLKEEVLTSPRRWINEGIWFTTIRNILIATLFELGFPPRILTKWYQTIR